MTVARPRLAGVWTRAPIVRSLALVAIALASCAIGASAQKVDSLGVVAGIVVDTGGRPLADADVQITGGSGVSSATRTRADGQFTIAHVTLGAHALRIRRVGFKVVAIPLVVTVGRNQELEVMLDEPVTELAGVEVREARAPMVGRLGGSTFEERRRMGFGSFVTRDQLEASHTSELIDVFKNVRGMRLSRKPDGHLALVNLHGGATPLTACEVRVFVDGVAVGNNYIEQLTTSEIESFEVYASVASLPLEYGGSTNKCGALGIWTRVGR